MDNTEKLATLCAQITRQNKKHNTICLGYHHTQDTRRRQTRQKKHNTISVRHHHAPHTR